MKKQYNKYLTLLHYEFRKNTHVAGIEQVTLD